MDDVCNCAPGIYNPSICFPTNSSTCVPAHGAQPGCCDSLPDAPEDSPSLFSCEAMLQGQNRLQRGINFMAYLAEIRADGQRPPHGLFYGGHDSLAFLTSEQFQAWAFDVPRHAAQEPLIHSELGTNVAPNHAAVAQRGSSAQKYAEVAAQSML